MTRSPASTCAIVLARRHERDGRVRLALAPVERITVAPAPGVEISTARARRRARRGSPAPTRSERSSASTCPGSRPCARTRGQPQHVLDAVDVRRERAMMIAPVAVRSLASATPTSASDRCVTGTIAFVGRNEHEHPFVAQVGELAEIPGARCRAASGPAEVARVHDSAAGVEIARPIPSTIECVSGYGSMRKGPRRTPARAPYVRRSAPSMPCSRSFSRGAPASAACRRRAERSRAGDTAARRRDPRGRASTPPRGSPPRLASAYEKSGSRSRSGHVVAGNINPQSTAMRSSPDSISIMLSPISPRPPRGMRRSFQEIPFVRRNFIVAPGPRVLEFWGAGARYTRAERLANSSIERVRRDGWDRSCAFDRAPRACDREAERRGQSVREHLGRCRTRPARRRENGARSASGTSGIGSTRTCTTAESDFRRRLERTRRHADRGAHVRVKLREHREAADVLPPGSAPDDRPHSFWSMSAISSRSPSALRSATATIAWQRCREIATTSTRPPAGRASAP